MADFTREEVLEKVQKGESLERADLSGVDLSKANLEGANLRRTDLEGVNFEEAKLKDGDRVRIAGLVLVRQRPGTATGIVFITLEDETGVANLVVWPKVMAAFRKVIMTARLMQVTGRLQRDPASGVTHIVVETLQDRSDVLLRLSDRSLVPPLSRADEVRNPIPAPAPGHPRNARIIPSSRDFH